MPTNAQKARAGGHLVVAELLRRGVGDVACDDRQRSSEIVATDTTQSRAVTLRIKTKTTGDWQTTTALGEPRQPDNDETSFWVLVDIGTDPDRAPTFHVVPDWWMRNYFHRELQTIFAATAERAQRRPAQLTARSSRQTSPPGADAGTRSASESGTP